VKKTAAMASKTSRELSQADANQQDRRGRRIALSCRLFFFGDDDFEGEAKVLDVSTNGCSVQSSIDVKIGMMLKLSLFLPDFKWPLRVDQAMVRWIDGNQFGLEFTSIRLAQRERLRGLIMKARL
jgi:PilZ domain